MNLKNLYNFKGWEMLLVFSFSYAVITLSMNLFVLNENYYYSAFGNQLDQSRIAEIIEINKKTEWLTYLITPLGLLIKWTLIAGALHTASIITDYEVSFTDCFKVVSFAELIMLLSSLVKLFYFMIYTPNSIEDLQNTNFLSLLQLFNINEIHSLLIFPLQQLNVFEIMYWLILSYGIMRFMKKDFSVAFRMTLFGYGPIFILIILCVIFIKLQFS